MSGIAALHGAFKVNKMNKHPFNRVCAGPEATIGVLLQVSRRGHPFERSAGADQVYGAARHWWKAGYGLEVMLKLSGQSGRVVRTCYAELAGLLMLSRLCLNTKARPRLGVKGDVKRRRSKAKVQPRKRHRQNRLMVAPLHVAQRQTCS